LSTGPPHFSALSGLLEKCFRLSSASGNRGIEVGAALGIREDAAQKRGAKALHARTERLRRRGFRVAGATVAALALQKDAGAFLWAWQSRLPRDKFPSTNVPHFAKRET